jgi:hypothetical protein
VIITLTKQERDVEAAERDRLATLDVTPEMIEAGMNELRCYGDGGETAEEIVTRIFLAMVEAWRARAFLSRSRP